MYWIKRLAKEFAQTLIAILIPVALFTFFSPLGHCQTAPTAAKYIGFVDQVQCTSDPATSYISGWIADLNHLDTSVTVTFQPGNSSVVMSQVATLSRPDVGAYLRDKGMHGFNVGIPSTWRPAPFAQATLTTSVRAVDPSGGLLGSGKFTVSCPATMVTDPVTTVPDPPWRQWILVPGTGLYSTDRLLASGDKETIISADGTTMPFYSRFELPCREGSISKTDDALYFCLNTSIEMVDVGSGNIHQYMQIIGVRKPRWVKVTIQFIPQPPDTTVIVH